MESISPGVYQNAEVFFTFFRKKANLLSSFTFFSKLMKSVAVCVSLKEMFLSDGKSIAISTFTILYPITSD